jgi:hypothetical protein
MLHLKMVRIKMSEFLGFLTSEEMER